MFDLKAFRKRNSLTQTQLAEYFGVTQAFISLIEKGKNEIPKEYISKIQVDNIFEIPKATDYKDLEPGHQVRESAASYDMGIDLFRELLKAKEEVIKAKEELIKAMEDNLKGNDELIRTKDELIKVLKEKCEENSIKGGVASLKRLGATPPTQTNG